jgi:8-oxo-dGTP diphosphatase
MQERVRAVIVQNNSLILIKRVKPHETYFVFPGGGVEAGESREEALAREMREELGVVEVAMKRLLVSWRSDRFEQIEHFYVCDVVGGEMGTGSGPEFQEGSSYEGTHEIVRVPLAEIPTINLRPSAAREWLEAL